MPLIDVILGPMRQSNGIQLSPEDTAIIAGWSSQRRLFETQSPSSSPPPAGRSSIAHVGADVHIIAANGSTSSPPKPSRSRPLATGSVARSPANYGQTVFLFNSIEPNSGDAILQPGPQLTYRSRYGPSSAGGGAFWALATWVRPLFPRGLTLILTTCLLRYVVPRRRPNLLHHPLRTSAFETLDGAITLTSSSGPSTAYTSPFSNVPGTSLSTTGAAQLTWAAESLTSSSGTSFAYTSSFSSVSGTLLSITRSAHDYPTGSTAFSCINLRLSSGAVADGCVEQG
ncbi:hypothetical protein C8R44DRAFT_990303 [Mycena epipterygia]|nr:hypothetical protein C8R44DRAFT_990303 [Mycena epipterygia]